MGRAPSCFIGTDDFERDFDVYRARGVRFVREPKTAPYGKVALFKDLYGNLWGPGSARLTPACLARRFSVCYPADTMTRHELFTPARMPSFSC